MSETTNNEPNEQLEPEPQAEPAPSVEEPAQAETDWKAEARKWEKRAKENKDAAERASEAAREAEEARERIKALEAEKQRRERLDAVAAETGVPTNILAMLNADSAEELQKQAETLAAQYAHPVIPDSGSPKTPTVTKQSILDIKNEKDRLEAIRNNVELFTN